MFHRFCLPPKGTFSGKEKVNSPLELIWNLVLFSPKKGKVEKLFKLEKLNSNDIASSWEKISFPFCEACSELGKVKFEPGKTCCELIIEKIIPVISDENLADYIDVFCEKNYFDIYDTDKILKCGIKYGLKPKVHVNQFNSLGGIKIAIENNAISVDHLEVINDQDIEYLKKRF